MPSTTLITYDYDETGLKPANKVVNEDHDVTLNHRAVAANYGPFFEQGLIVRNALTGVILTPHTDYAVAVLYENAALATGKAVYCFVVINNLSLTKISLTYQTIGGEYTRYTSAIADLLEELSLNQAPVEWGSLLGLPAGFTPAPHQHPASQIYNWGEQINKLEEIRQAILVGDQSAFADLQQWVTNQLNLSGTPIATPAEALTGTDNAKRITPYNLKSVLDTRFTAANVPSFEFEVNHVDDDWGYWRHKESGFQVCWGTTNAIVSGGAYRAYFRRRFSFKPTIAGSAANITTDTTPTGTQWVELVASVVDHTVAPDSFYVAANRVNGSGSDGVRFRYFACGYADNTQPLATSPGVVAAVPPTGNAVTQPVWTGSTAVNLVTPATGTYRMGIVFPSSVSGGGFTFNDATQTQLAQFFYTLYPGLFDDTLYEIKGTLSTPTTYNPNVTYTGLALDTWVDLSTVKALPSNALTSGFTWTTTGLYGGVITLTVDIRLKSNTAITASRTFTFDRDSTAIRPRLGSYNNLITAATFKSGAIAPKAIRLNPLSSTHIELVVEAGVSNSTYSGSTFQLVNNANDAAFVSADLSGYEARLSRPNGSSAFTIGGGSLTATSSYAVDQGAGWYSCDTLSAMSNQWALTTTGNTSVTEQGAVYFQLRHKTDIRKFTQIPIAGIRAGTDRIPVWSGSTSASGTVPAWNGAVAGGVVVFDIIFPTDQAAGVGYWRLQRSFSSNVYTTSGNFTYALGLSSVDDANYAALAVNFSNTGIVLTKSSSVGVPYRMDTGEIKYTWTGNVTANTDLEVDVTVYDNEYGIAGATATQRFSMVVNLA